MSVLVRHVASLLLPVALVIAAAMLVKSYAAVGDGFSAGVIAALGVLLQYLGQGRERARKMVHIAAGPAFLVVGILLMLAVVLVPTLLGHSLVTHFPGPEAAVLRFGALEAHSALLFDFGVFLVVLSALVLVIDHLIELPLEEG